MRECVRLSKRGWMDRLARGGTKYTKYTAGFGRKGRGAEVVGDSCVDASW